MRLLIQMLAVALFLMSSDARSQEFSAGGIITSTPSCVSILDIVGGPTNVARVECFALGQNTAVWHNTFALATTTWGAWTDLGGRFAFRPECVALGSAGDFRCFAIRSSDGVMEMISRIGGALGTWRPIGGVWIGPPSCVVSLGRSITCFGRGQDRTIYSVTIAGTGATPTVGPITWRAQPLADDPNCFEENYGIGCYGRGANDQLVRVHFRQGATPVREDFGGVLTEPLDCVHVVRHGSWCFGRGQQPTFNVYGRLTNLSFGAWHNYGGRIHGSPSCVSEASGQVSCFVVGLNNLLFRQTTVLPNPSMWTPVTGSVTPLATGPGDSPAPDCFEVTRLPRTDDKGNRVADETRVACAARAAAGSLLLLLLP